VEAITYRVRNGGWVTTSPWPYLIDEGPLTVPAGFVCDLASVPRILTVLLPRERLGLAGPILHDAVYRGTVGRGPHITLTRRRADQLFHVLMRCDGVSRLTAHIAWAAVRAFGWLAWRRLPSAEWALAQAD
jgi:hypothetical protein